MPRQQQLIECVKQFYGLAMTDLERAIEECVAPDGGTLINPLPAHVPFGGTHEGVEGLRRYMALIAEHIQIEKFDLDEMLCDGHTVVVIGRESSLVHSTGKRYTMAFVHVLRVTPEGRIIELREYNDTAALGAAFE